MLSSFKDALHAISSCLQVPVIIILLLFVAVSVVELGGLLAEMLVERRQARVDVSELLDLFQGRDAAEIMAVIDNSRLFRRQKAALGELVRHSHLPPATLEALGRRLLASEELHCARSTALTEMVARLGPMFGLMATLIPLGPGLIALGQGDTKTLADSLLTAFDATVTGLAAAGISFAITRVRKRWYEDYLSALEALIEGLLDLFSGGRMIETEKEVDEIIASEGVLGSARRIEEQPVQGA
jgi:biopolymer transport protein ExbB/TolQ